jgi:N-acetylglutamate synthase-like GNAT family acetyltransferase
VTFPEVRGRGFASAITSRIVATAEEAGAQELFLLTEPRGPLSLYEALGFRRTGLLASSLGRLSGSESPDAGRSPQST